MFKILKEKISKIITNLTSKEYEIEEKDIEKFFKEYEIDFLEADISFEVVQKLKEDLKKNLVGKKFETNIKKIIKESLEEILTTEKIDIFELLKNKKPILIVFFGYNGSGKTTLIAKIANLILKNNKSCVIAAADTFRAASIEQIEEHAKKLKVKVIKQKYGADPAAVIFDAVNYAKANGIDFVLADTAGRIHSNINLLDEMKKIVRVNKPDLKVLVIDSLVGNDVVDQIKYFSEVGVDAYVFTKLDINEKGGCIFSAMYLNKKPILFLSNGQNYDSLEIFDSKKFLDKIFNF